MRHPGLRIGAWSNALANVDLAADGRPWGYAGKSPKIDVRAKADEPHMFGQTRSTALRLETGWFEPVTAVHKGFRGCAFRGCRSEYLRTTADLQPLPDRQAH